MKRAVCAFGLLLLFACSRPSPKAPGRPSGPPAFPVETREVVPTSVEYAVSAVGSVEAFERVQVTARVAGVLEKIRFVEGQAVAARDVLAEIEPRRFQLAVRASRATLERARAQVAEAEVGLQRRQEVEKNNPGLIRGEELETWKTRALTARAEESAAQVALEQAELNLSDAFVRAPMPGVLQTRSVETGQYVQPGTVLATLLRKEPLLLRFKVPEAEASQLTVKMPLRFTVRGVDEPFEARLTHLADLTEENTRLVSATAEVTDAKKEKLRPGTFAQVTLPVASSSKSLVVPQSAIRPTEKGFVAFVVEKGVAQERILTLGMRTPEGNVEVTKGLSAGDRLVVRGNEALRPGAAVRVATGDGGRP